MRARGLWIWFLLHRTGAAPELCVQRIYEHIFCLCLRLCESVSAALLHYSVLLGSHITLRRVYKRARDASALTDAVK